MSWLDLLRFPAIALLRHRLRSALSLLGVSIGVSAVILLCSLGEGARRYVAGQFQFLGTNLLVVLPGKVQTTGGVPGFGGVPNDLTLPDALALQRSVPDARTLTPVSMGNETISHGERSRQAIVLGTTSEMYRIHSLAMQAGTFLPEGDLDRGAPIVVLGRALAAQLFPGREAVGRVVRIGEWRMRVTGVLQDRGMHMGFDIDEVAYVPVATAMKMFNRRSLFRILLQVDTHTDLETARRRVLEVLTDRHGEEDVTCLTADAVVSALSDILGMLTLALAGIAAVSLAVAGIGIMNVMLVSVSERTGEVGLLKAVGARRRQVLGVFLVEAILLSGTGGLLGLLASLGVVRVVGLAFPAFPVAAPWWSIVASLSLSLAVGALFGVLPARRAIQLDPVAALARMAR